MRCPAQKVYLFFFHITGKKREKGSKMYLGFRSCDVMGISSQSMNFKYIKLNYRISISVR